MKTIRVTENELFNAINYLNQIRDDINSKQYSSVSVVVSKGIDYLSTIILDNSRRTDE